MRSGSGRKEALNLAQSCERSSIRGPSSYSDSTQHRATNLRRLGDSPCARTLKRGSDSLHHYARLLCAHCALAPRKRELMERVEDHFASLLDRVAFGDRAGHLDDVGGKSTLLARFKNDRQLALHLVLLYDRVVHATLLLKWKAVPRAVYEAEWFAADPALPDSQRIGLSIATASRLVILGLTPGQQIWARVRAKRGKRFGPWSEAGTRIVNV